MKTKSRNANNENQDSFPIVCFNSCRRFLDQLAEVKQTLISKYGNALKGQEEVLRSALNEAEAIAWQTPYPHLFFPTLAEEKAISVRRWAVRQEMVRQGGWARAFAA